MSSPALPRTPVPAPESKPVVERSGVLRTILFFTALFVVGVAGVNFYMGREEPAKSGSETPAVNEVTDVDEVTDVNEVTVVRDDAAVAVDVVDAGAGSASVASDIRAQPTVPKKQPPKRQPPRRVMKPPHQPTATTVKPPVPPKPPPPEPAKPKCDPFDNPKGCN